MNLDWRYSEHKLNLRSECLLTLLQEFGSDLHNGAPKYSNQSLYECTHDWISQGAVNSNGIIEYYNKYYESGKLA